MLYTPSLPRAFHPFPSCTLGCRKTTSGVFLSRLPLTPPATFTSASPPLLTFGWHPLRIYGLLEFCLGPWTPFYVHVPILEVFMLFCGLHPHLSECTHGFSRMGPGFPSWPPPAFRPLPCYLPQIFFHPLQVQPPLLPKLFGPFSFHAFV